MALQPASTTFHAFAGPTPPSISIQGSTPFASHMAFNSLIFCTWDSMKLWPPKPGFTDMMRMRSTSSSTYSIAERGVPGLRTTPAAQPACLIWLIVRCKWIVEAASQCTEMMSAPALAKSSTRCSGSTIIKWQSSSASGSFLRSASTTKGPMVMLGTNRPSMTSTCTQSAPALRTSSTSWPNFEKSADKMDGEIFTVFGPVRRASTRGFAARRATACAAVPRGCAAVRRRRKAAAAVAAPTKPMAAKAPQPAAPADGAEGSVTTTKSFATPDPRRTCCVCCWVGAC
mmetsp:Transcript_9760/g.26355  ORF Transcript_9760/g.26355 Transcript_9760/m.26355 type:complete len:286 (-) Transcript_9760:127-984(-)